jgi:hypothetical protein
MPLPAPVTIVDFPSRRIHTSSISFPAWEPERAGGHRSLCRKNDQWLTV